MISIIIIHIYMAFWALGKVKNLGGGGYSKLK